MCVVLQLYQVDSTGLNTHARIAKLVMQRLPCDAEAGNDTLQDQPYVLQ